MKIACNYYNETEQLFDEGIIDIDYFKYPGLGFQLRLMEDLDAFEKFCERITAKRPILLHGLHPAPHDLASVTLRDDFDDEIAGRLIKASKTPGLSFHQSLSGLPENLNTIIDNARFVKEKYADMAFVSLENFDGARWGELLKPEIITRLLDESGCGFLLDISHAYCASLSLNIPFYDYLRKLPLEKTVEIHVNGWITFGNSVMCHTKIHDEAYEALRLVLEYCNPQIITVEYGRNNDRLGAGVPLLSENQINERAKHEITEQIDRIKEICKLKDRLYR